jgi:alkanesulfonate monooxygenase SsuD/methylene tetrahydromethanopterin reductase-like flavin-dependent oxidoreductase (luciferase family)
VEIWGVELENGQRVSVASEEQAHSFARQSGSTLRSLTRREPSLFKGTPEAVREALQALHEEYGIDEFIIDTPVAEGAERLASLQLLAEAHAAAEVAV